MSRTTYRPEHCDAAIEFLAGGYSMTALAGHLGCARSTLFEWVNAHPEFSDAVKIGQAQSALWWEQAIVRVAMTGEGNAKSIIFGLKNRASSDWREKVETEHSGSMTVNRVERTVVDPLDPNR